MPPLNSLLGQNVLVKILIKVLCKISGKFFKKFHQSSLNSVKMQIRGDGVNFEMWKSSHFAHARLFTKTFQLRSQVLPTGSGFCCFSTNWSANYTTATMFLTFHGFLGSSELWAATRTASARICRFFVTSLASKIFAKHGIKIVTYYQFF